jgi:hypothetical protein|nr:MAG TPA: ASCH domain protein [Caudoviricetes sp.]
MAIKPILFNTEMVRAILDGRKSCTRRICKDANECTVPDMDFYNAEKRTYAVHNYSNREHTEQLSTAERSCPICPGDILYVRETWEHFECWNCEGDERGNCPNEPQKSVLDKTCGCYMYRATNEIRGDARWHPSIHMPKEAARIWLRVTDVRVERLQEITGASIQKEGIEVDQKEYASKFDFISELFLLFQRLWDSVVKKSDLDRYGWDASPYVWVIEFERCEKPEEV